MIDLIILYIYVYIIMANYFSVVNMGDGAPYMATSKHDTNTTLELKNIRFGMANEDQVDQIRFGEDSEHNVIMMLMKGQPDNQGDGDDYEFIVPSNDAFAFVISSDQLADGPVTGTKKAISFSLVNENDNTNLVSDNPAFNREINSVAITNISFELDNGSNMEFGDYGDQNNPTSGGGVQIGDIEVGSSGGTDGGTGGGTGGGTEVGTQHTADEFSGTFSWDDQKTLPTTKEIGDEMNVVDFLKYTGTVETENDMPLPDPGMKIFLYVNANDEVRNPLKNFEEASFGQHINQIEGNYSFVNMINFIDDNNNENIYYLDNTHKNLLAKLDHTLFETENEGNKIFFNNVGSYYILIYYNDRKDVLSTLIMSNKRELRVAINPEGLLSGGQFSYGTGAASSEFGSQIAVYGRSWNYTPEGVDSPHEIAYLNNMLTITDEKFSHGNDPNGGGYDILNTIDYVSFLLIDTSGNKVVKVGGPEPENRITSPDDNLTGTYTIELFQQQSEFFKLSIDNIDITMKSKQFTVQFKDVFFINYKAAVPALTNDDIDVQGEGISGGIISLTQYIPTEAQKKNNTPNEIELLDSQYIVSYMTGGIDDDEYWIDNIPGTLPGAYSLKVRVGKSADNVGYTQLFILKAKNTVVSTLGESYKAGNSIVLTDVIQLTDNISESKGELQFTIKYNNTTIDNATLAGYDTPYQLILSDNGIIIITVDYTGSNAYLSETLKYVIYVGPTRATISLNSSEYFIYKADNLVLDNDDLEVPAAITDYIDEQEALSSFDDLYDKTIRFRIFGSDTYSKESAKIDFIYQNKMWNGGLDTNTYTEEIDTRWGNTRYFHTDQLGSITSINLPVGQSVRIKYDDNKNLEGDPTEQGESIKVITLTPDSTRTTPYLYDFVNTTNITTNNVVISESLTIYTKAITQLIFIQLQETTSTPLLGVGKYLIDLTLSEKTEDGAVEVFDTTTHDSKLNVLGPSFYVQREGNNLELEHSSNILDDDQNIVSENTKLYLKYGSENLAGINNGSEYHRYNNINNFNISKATSGQETKVEVNSSYFNDLYEAQFNNTNNNENEITWGDTQVTHMDANNFNLSVVADQNLTFNTDGTAQDIQLKLTHKTATDFSITITDQVVIFSNIQTQINLLFGEEGSRTDLQTEVFDSYNEDGFIFSIELTSELSTSIIDNINTLLSTVPLTIEGINDTSNYKLRINSTELENKNFNWANNNIEVPIEVLLNDSVVNSYRNSFMSEQNPTSLNINVTPKTITASNIFTNESSYYADNNGSVSTSGDTLSIYSYGYSDTQTVVYLDEIGLLKNGDTFSGNIRFTANLSTTRGRVNARVSIQYKDQNGSVLAMENQQEYDIYNNNMIDMNVYINPNNYSHMLQNTEDEIHPCIQIEVYNRSTRRITTQFKNFKIEQQNFEINN